jgi:hypothetical protein
MEKWGSRMAYIAPFFSEFLAQRALMMTRRSPLARLAARRGESYLEDSPSIYPSSFAILIRNRGTLQFFVRAEHHQVMVRWRKDNFFSPGKVQQDRIF